MYLSPSPSPFTFSSGRGGICDDRSSFFCPTLMREGVIPPFAHEKKYGHPLGIGEKILVHTALKAQKKLSWRNIGPRLPLPAMGKDGPNFMGGGASYRWARELLCVHWWHWVKNGKKCHISQIQSPWIYGWGYAASSHRISLGGHRVITGIIFTIKSKCLLCDGGLSLGSWCKIAELDWHPHINGDCIAEFQHPWKPWNNPLNIILEFYCRHFVTTQVQFK